MMRLRIQEVGSGLHPSEVVVAIETSEGPARLVVDKRSVRGGYLNVGHPIDRQGDEVLVELPRETTTGAWRVWVSEDKVQSNDMVAAE